MYVCFAFHHYISTGFLVRSNLLCSLWVYYYTLFLDVPSRFLTCFLFRKIGSKAEKVVFEIIECVSKPYIPDSYLVLFIWVKKVMTIVVWKVQFFCHIRYSHKLVYNTCCLNSENVSGNLSRLQVVFSLCTILSLSCEWINIKFYNHDLNFPSS